MHLLINQIFFIYLAKIERLFFFLIIPIVLAHYKWSELPQSIHFPRGVIWETGCVFRQIVLQAVDNQILSCSKVYQYGYQWKLWLHTIQIICLFYISRYNKPSRVKIYPRGYKFRYFSSCSIRCTNLGFIMKSVNLLDSKVIYCNFTFSKLPRDKTYLLLVLLMGQNYPSSGLITTQWKRTWVE